MRAGLLREYVQFQSKTNVSDSGGGFTSTWINTFADRVRLKPIKRDEVLQQEQNQQQNQFEVTLRYRTDINRNMRIIWGTRTLTIISDPINFDEKRKWLRLVAKQE